MDVQDMQLEACSAGVCDLPLQVAAHGVEQCGGTRPEGEWEKESFLLTRLGVFHPEGFHAFDHFGLHIFVEIGLAQGF